jgi:hypothetical protein
MGILYGGEHLVSRFSCFTTGVRAPATLRISDWVRAWSNLEGMDKENNPFSWPGIEPDSSVIQPLAY